MPVSRSNSRAISFLLPHDWWCTVCPILALPEKQLLPHSRISLAFQDVVCFGHFTRVPNSYCAYRSITIKETITWETRKALYDFVQASNPDYRNSRFISCQQQPCSFTHSSLNNPILGKILFSHIRRDVGSLLERDQPFTQPCPRSSPLQPSLGYHRRRRPSCHHHLRPSAWIGMIRRAF